MTITGMPMRKSIGRAAAGVVVGLPATFVAAFASAASAPMRPGSIDLVVWLAIAPAQALTAWFGARLAQRIAGESLSRIMAVALLATGAVKLHSSVTGRWSESEPVNWPTVSQGRRDLAERFDRFCGRLNDGLIAVTIVLAALVFLVAAYRAAETVVIPQGFETIGTTWVSPAIRGCPFVAPSAALRVVPEGFDMPDRQRRRSWSMCSPRTGDFGPLDLASSGRPPNDALEIIWFSRPTAHPSDRWGYRWLPFGPALTGLTSGMPTILASHMQTISGVVPVPL
jgi:hypothetical protein